MDRYKNRLMYLQHMLDKSNISYVDTFDYLWIKGEVVTGDIASLRDNLRDIDFTLSMLNNNNGTVTIEERQGWMRYLNAAYKCISDYDNTNWKKV